LIIFDVVLITYYHLLFVVIAMVVFANLLLFFLVIIEYLSLLSFFGFDWKHILSLNEYFVFNVKNIFPKDF